MPCSGIGKKRKRTSLTLPTLPSLSDLQPELLTDIFCWVVRDSGVGEYFNLVRFDLKCRVVAKSPPVLQIIKFEELPLREDCSQPVRDFIIALLRSENPDVLYLEGVELAFGLETDYPAEKGWSFGLVNFSALMLFTLSACLKMR